MGGLTAEEEIELLRDWRAEFERSFAPHFGGVCARYAHWLEAGIPRDLLKQWLADRRSAAKRIRELEAAANPI
jgi:hypothetical protein